MCGLISFTHESSPACCFRDIDKVDDLMQDITEQQELAQEISDAISKPVGFGEEFDEVSGAFDMTVFTSVRFLCGCLLNTISDSELNSCFEAGG